VRARPRWLYALTLVTLLGVLLLIPEDTCGASTSGACVLASADPAPARVAAGETARLRLGTVKVTSVAAAPHVVVEGPGSPSDHPSTGTVILVTVEASAAERTRPLRGTLYSGTKEYSTMSFGTVSMLVAAGITSRVPLIFELPHEAVTDAMTVRAYFADDDAAEVALGSVPRQEVVRWVTR